MWPKNDKNAQMYVFNMNKLVGVDKSIDITPKHITYSDSMSVVRHNLERIINGTRISELIGAWCVRVNNMFETWKQAHKYFPHWNSNKCMHIAQNSAFCCVVKYCQIIYWLCWNVERIHWFCHSTLVVTCDTVTNKIKMINVCKS